MATPHPRLLVAVMIATSAIFWLSMGTGAYAAHQLFFGLPDRAALHRVTDMARASVFYDRLGRPAFTISKEQRIEVPLARMSPHLKQAIVAIEDQRFYSHRGVDPVRIVGAAIANLREGARAQGGSTITQQLARLSFLTLDKTYTRKLQEAVLAALIETEFSKDQILELYLNKAYFGNGLYGAEAAALGYFGKHADALTLAEAALLAGLVKAPSNYAPTVHLERAVARRAVVLTQMREMGVVDQAAADEAKNAAVTLTDLLRREEPYGRFFKEHVREELVARFGEARVYEGGLRVFTTLDLEMQRAADAQVQRALEQLDGRRAALRRASRHPLLPTETPLQAALVAMDPRTGEVRALVGGRDFKQSNYDRATRARRQAGSAFKPFVYAAALEAGYTPATLITDLDLPVDTPQGDWVPEDEHSDASAISMRAALRSSSNRAAVRMIQQVGVSQALGTAARLGVRGVPPVPSAALGAGEVTLETLTAAYAVFASEGIRRLPVYITRVEDAQGRVLHSASAIAERILTPDTAFLMTDMLADVIDHGTAWKARQLGFRLPAAGKTGTTNEYRDAWFVGYTPRLVTGVWVGFDQPQTIMRGGYAAEVSVPLWASFMREATKDDPRQWFNPPSNVRSVSICRLSGKRATDVCRATPAEGDASTRASMVIAEYFTAGTEPAEDCPLHVRALETRRAAWLGGVPWGSPTTVSPSDIRADRGRVDEERRVESAAAPAPAAKAAEPKKRGFWSRLFGRGGSRAKDDSERKK